MQFLANENISGTVIRELRRQGHDVLSAKDSMPGQSDRAILERASREKRLVITHDKDFGELAFRFGLPAECGIVLFRLEGRDPEGDNWRVLTAIQSRADWSGHFAVVSDRQIRIRELPAPKKRQ